MKGQITPSDLKQFQLVAVEQLLEMLMGYPSNEYPKWYDQSTGKPYPFLGRLHAITGSGKTPMLAYCANGLKNAIILWTTNRGAIISQTYNNLSVGGKYNPLLPIDSDVRILSDLSDMDWSDILNQNTGLTIILSTVASYNQDGDNLRIHRQGENGSLWQILSGTTNIKRNRDLYVFYDEGHGATSQQFSKLLELNPKAVLLASASKIPSDLVRAVPGNTNADKESHLIKQTAIVPISEVVKEGLLKQKLYFVDCKTSRQEALEIANDRLITLQEKLFAQGSREWPIMCCIVNSTTEGLEVWRILTQDIGVDPSRIAVHLANVGRAVSEMMIDAPWHQLIDTYSKQKTPDALRDEGYRYIIWNLSLREGWDEPWAYVAYLDGLGRSSIDISQKIGRFLRQPYATQFAEPELNAAYFYFNILDEDFLSILKSTQESLSHEGHEVIFLSSGDERNLESELVPLKSDSVPLIPKLNPYFGDDLSVLDNIVLERVPEFSANALLAPGQIKIAVIDTETNEADSSLESSETRENSAEITVWQYLTDRLSEIDNRIVKRNESTRFSSALKGHPKMRQRMSYGSEALKQLSETVENIAERLNDEFCIVYEPDDFYEIPPFRLTSPNLNSDNEKTRERYKVREYSNSLHRKYNGLNPDESDFATAIDKTGLQWCRNPSNKGYVIPIPLIGGVSKNFFPDFLVWSKEPNLIWAIDPKGFFLVNEAIFDKLLSISSVPPEHGLPYVKVALVVKGKYIKDGNTRVKRSSQSGYTFITTNGNKLKIKSAPNLDELLKEIQ